MTLSSLLEDKVCNMLVISIVIAIYEAIVNFTAKGEIVNQIVIALEQKVACSSNCQHHLNDHVHVTAKGELVNHIVNTARN